MDRRDARDEGAASLALALCFGLPAVASAFPVKPLRVIVPFAPGGNTSFVMRAVAQTYEQHLGQSIVIDHRSGAQGVVGLQIGAQAAPDGYTLTLTDSASVIVRTQGWPLHAAGSWAACSCR